MTILRIIAALFFLAVACHGASIPRSCSFSGNVDEKSEYQRDDNYEEDSNDEEIGQIIPLQPGSPEVDTETCGRGEDHCYALWSLDESQNGVEMKRQGCWTNSDSGPLCESSECITEYDVESQQKYLFCCCNKDFCNAKVSWKIVHQATPPTADNPGNYTVRRPKASALDYWENSQILWLSVLTGLILLMTLILVVILRRTAKENKAEEHSQAPVNGPGYSANEQNVDNLKLISLIGQGKYGTVWKGLLNNDTTVALKIYPSHHKQFYLHEREIFNVPLLEHDALVRYLGYDERQTIDGRQEFMLILSLADLGCLQDWLLQNTSTFAQFCTMSTSVARGLSHLHSVLKKGYATKPAICHRDLNSRNILVKADMTCCIADFSFALKTAGPRFECNSEWILAETRGIMEVGTLRYMSPELLEGAVNLKDCESALKQIDIYSFGLVLWELATRCRDFYTNEEHTPPPYSAPYESATGKHPSYEQMQNIVCREKLRPSFPRHWQSTGVTKLIQETCADCWDQDPEARVTSLCVEERLKSLANVQRRTSASEQDQKARAGKERNKKEQPKISQKPIKKERSSFKLSARKLKRYRLENLYDVRSLFQKRIFKRQKLENENLAPKASVVAPAKKPTAKRPTDLAIRPRNHGPSIHDTTEHHQTDLAILRSINTKESARLDKKVLCSSRLSLQPMQDSISISSVEERPDRSALASTMTRQRSLEVFREVFGDNGPTLRDPSERIKTPGDVPMSVRKKARRVHKTLSLYDDRIMNWSNSI